MRKPMNKEKYMIKLIIFENKRIDTNKRMDSSIINTADSQN